MTTGKTVVDAGALLTALGTVLNYLPAISALFSIVWLSIRIYESRTVQEWLAGRRRVSVPFSNKRFFDEVRATVFGGRMSQDTVDGLNSIIDALHKHNVFDMDPSFAGAILATAYLEVGRNMQPVREGFKQTDEQAREHVRNLWRRGIIGTDYAKRHENGNSYYGRGFVQLSWGDNYKKLGKRLNLPLYEKPDLALQPDIAAEILVVGSLEGLFTGKKLGDFLPDQPAEARQVINGMDRADEYARLVRLFTAAVKAAGA